MRERMDKRIDRAIADAGGSITFHDLALALYPDRESHRYSSNGGPPGCYMTLSRSLRLYGFGVSIVDVGSGGRIVTARPRTT